MSKHVGYFSIGVVMACLGVVEVVRHEDFGRFLFFSLTVVCWVIAGALHLHRQHQGRRQPAAGSTRRMHARRF